MNGGSVKKPLIQLGKPPALPEQSLSLTVPRLALRADLSNGMGLRVPSTVVNDGEALGVRQFAAALAA